MNDVMVVGQLKNDGNEVNGIRILNHTTYSDKIIRNKVVLENNVFSLLVEGTKIVHTPDNSFKAESDQILMLSSGNYLMTEKIASHNKQFHTILIFFTQYALQDFFYKHPEIIEASKNSEIKHVKIFNKDAYLNNFIQSLDILTKGGNTVPPFLVKNKFTELMLYLFVHYPEKMHSLKMEAGLSDSGLRQLVESHIESNITIDELAFLGNMSLSTFKRKFHKIYGTTPSKWFLQKRMSIATTLLSAGNEKPSEVYYKVGYESHSGFAHSFKQVFGITPTEYRERISA